MLSPFLFSLGNSLFALEAMTMSFKLSTSSELQLAVLFIFSNNLSVVELVESFESDEDAARS